MIFFIYRKFHSHTNTVAKSFLGHKLTVHVYKHVAGINHRNLLHQQHCFFHDQFFSFCMNYPLLYHAAIHLFLYTHGFSWISSGGNFFMLAVFLNSIITNILFELSWKQSCPCVQFSTANKKVHPIKKGICELASSLHTFVVPARYELNVYMTTSGWILKNVS